MHVKQNLDVRLQLAPLIRGANAHSHLSRFSIEEEKVRKCKLLRMLCITACTFATQHAALAQTAWPSRPIRLVVPFAPPSSTDDIARMLATKLTARLNQPVIVENKPGAGGTLGTDFVAKAPPRWIHHIVHFHIGCHSCSQRQKTAARSSEGSGTHRRAGRRATAS